MKTNELFEEVDEYFKDFVRFINKHHYVAETHKSDNPKLYENDSEIHINDLKVYKQKLLIHLEKEFEDIQFRNIVDKLEYDVGTIMQSHYIGGSRQIKLLNHTESTMTVELTYISTK